MNWNDYEAVWKRQPLPVGAEADIAELRATFETKRRKLAAAIQMRDYAEGGTGIVLSVVFGVVWWNLGKAGWPFAFVLLLILFVTARFVWERIRARRRKLGDEASLLDKVEFDLAELRHQERLLHGMWWWYLGPIAIAALIGHFTLHFQLPEPQRDPVICAGFVVFYALCFWFAWWINHQAARKQLEPRLAELEKLRRDLQSPA